MAKGLTLTVACLLAISLMELNNYVLVMAQSNVTSELISQTSFAADLHSIIVEKKSKENVCYSPASIHNCLSLIYLGAADHTSDEIRKLLKLEHKDKTEFFPKYGKFLKNIFHKVSPDTEEPRMKMITRIYVNSKIKILQRFSQQARDHFNCEAENVDFSQSLTAVEKINKWAEEQTESKIKHILEHDALKEDDSCVLVNVIYFKAKWLHPFSVSSTSKSYFHKSCRQKVEVDIMYTEADFGYAELPDLKAKALELPYKNSDISMLILLPNAIGGLKNLLKKLKGVDLNSIIGKLEKQTVDVFLPKFRLEFEISLKETLVKMGCPSMFSHNASLTGIFESATPHRITDIKHKAFLECNEAGSEAAAVTFAKAVPMSLNLHKKVFRANHPFVFLIRSKDVVYFEGHVASI